MMGSSTKFLDTYSEADLNHALVDAGLDGDMAEMGFKSLVLQLDTSDSFVHRCTFTDKTLIDDASVLASLDSPFPTLSIARGRFVPTENNFLIDLFARRKMLKRHDFAAYRDLRAQLDVFAAQPQQQTLVRQPSDDSSDSLSRNVTSSTLLAVDAAHPLSSEQIESPMFLPAAAFPTVSPVLRRLQEEHAEFDSALTIPAVTVTRADDGAAVTAPTSPTSPMSPAAVESVMHAPSRAFPVTLQRGFAIPSVDLVRRVRAFMRASLPPPLVPASASDQHAHPHRNHPRHDNNDRAHGYDPYTDPAATPDAVFFAHLLRQHPDDAAPSRRKASSRFSSPASTAATAASHPPAPPHAAPIVHSGASTAPPLSATVVEWLCMQTPSTAAASPVTLARFPPGRPPCPGQRHPGLHVAGAVGHVMIHLAVANGRDTLVNVPEHAHNALMYMAGGYVAASPAFQGYVRAVARDLEDDLRVHGLAAVSWAFRNGHVRDRASGCVEM
ncbi:hypothetical protein HK405_015481 [Cladochytrium tenue]|nr:hypothetical protein HK405_015481 [Cladochytrium tenue]